MEDVLLSLGFDKEDINGLLYELDKYNSYILKRNIDSLLRYNCDNGFIKYIVSNRSDVLSMDCDRLTYILDAIISNNDIIEETLLDLV